MLMINLPEEANSIDGGIGASDGAMRADDASTDGSANDTDATPDQTSGSKSSGCKCNMPGDVSGAVGPMILAGLLFLVQRRRRR
jgi:MYXO-CTERM domain-containing protein